MVMNVEVKVQTTEGKYLLNEILTLLSRMVMSLRFSV